MFNAFDAFSWAVAGWCGAFAFVAAVERKWSLVLMNLAFVGMNVTYALT